MDGRYSFQTHFDSPMVNTVAMILEARRTGKLDIGAEDLKKMIIELVRTAYGGYCATLMGPIENSSDFYREIFQNP